MSRTGFLTLSCLATFEVFPDTAAGWLSALTPALRPVPDMQNFNNLFSETIHNYVRRADKFAGSLDLSGSTKAGKRRQLFDAVDNRPSDVPTCRGIILLDALD